MAGSTVLRIGVISDSHGFELGLRCVADTLRPLNVDALFHLGDFASDAQQLAALLERPVYNVRGNCDCNGAAPLECVVELGGHRFFLTHGHRYRVDWGEEELVQAAREQECQVVLYGHTHFPCVCQQGGLWVMNPGSPFRPRGFDSTTCGLIEVSPKRVACCLLTV